MQDLSHICDLHHSSWQCQILNPLSKARDQTCILMNLSQVPYCWAAMGTPRSLFFFSFLSFCCCCCYFLGRSCAYGGSQARGWIGAVATGLRQSHSNVGSKPRLRPTPQLTATLDPQPTEQGTEPATSWFLVGFVNHCATTGTPTYRLFNDSHSDLCEVVPHCSFDLHFSNN